MEDLAFRKEIIMTLEDYYRKRIKISEYLRFKNGLKPISLNEFDTMCQEKFAQEFSLESLLNDKTPIPDYALRIKISDEELDDIFSYMESFLLNNDLTRLPNCENDSFFFAEMFKKIILTIDHNSVEYRKIMKYLRGMSVMRFTLINEKISGKIETISNYCFLATDYLGQCYIYYPKLEKNFTRYVSTPNPVLQNNNLALIKLIVNQESTIFILGIVKKDCYLSIVDHKEYPKNNKNCEFSSFSSLDYFLELNNLSFLKCDIYGYQDCVRLMKSLNFYASLDTLTRYDVETLAHQASLWWLRQYLSYYSLTVAQEVKEKAYMTLKNAIKKSLLENELNLILTDTDNLSLELAQTKKMLNLPSKALNMTMKITKEQITVERCDNDNASHQLVFNNGKRWL